jgi:hypothetical protein
VLPATYTAVKQRKTLEQLSQQIAHETDDDQLSVLISELQVILQTEQQEVRDHNQNTFTVLKKLA